ncbi:unnamed protein product [Rhodiola kirilowii]
MKSRSSARFVEKENCYTGGSEASAATQRNAIISDCRSLIKTKRRLCSVCNKRWPALKWLKALEQAIAYDIPVDVSEDVYAT